MDDVFYIFMMIVFVVVAALFVVGCDRIIGPDDPALDELQRDDAALDCHEVAACLRPVGLKSCSSSGCWPSAPRSWVTRATSSPSLVRACASCPRAPERSSASSWRALWVRRAQLPS